MAEKNVEKKEKLQGKKAEEKKEKKSLLRVPRIGKKEAEKKTEELKKFEGDPYDILKFVLMTEKAVRMVELQNKLVFVVDMKADKPTITSAAESAFGSKVTSVETMIDQSGRKKAFVKFEKPGEAGEIAIRLGII